jgi:hypothetical protein
MYKYLNKKFTVVVGLLFVSLLSTSISYAKVVAFRGDTGTGTTITISEEKQLGANTFRLDVAEFPGLAVTGSFLDGFATVLQKKEDGSRENIGSVNVFVGFGSGTFEATGIIDVEINTFGPSILLTVSFFDINLSIEDVPDVPDIPDVPDVPDDILSEFFLPDCDLASCCPPGTTEAGVIDEDDLGGING